MRRAALIAAHTTRRVPAVIGRSQNVSISLSCSHTNVALPPSSSRPLSSSISLLKNDTRRYLSASASSSSRGPSKPLKDSGAVEKEPSVWSKENKEAPPKPLPILPRPLGVPNPPKTEPQTWQEKRDDLLDRKKHLEKRRLIMKQINSGYYEDFFKTTKGGWGGKTWIAPKVLIREDKSLYLPDIAGKSLTKENVHTTTLCKDHISIVTISSTQIGDDQIKSFTETVEKVYKLYRRFKFIQINLQENFLKSALVSLSAGNLRSMTPLHLHPTYIHSSQNMEMVREAMGLENKHLGYVYLVDENAKIRWAGCGFAIEDEKKALFDCTGLLLERLGEKMGETDSLRVGGEKETLAVQEEMEKQGLISPTTTTSMSKSPTASPVSAFSSITAKGTRTHNSQH
ncbi:Mitochondrial ATPase complex subunit atp10 [Tulasnella sp. JGI-2019a]|nr:Mitochondrial ATPase complex subunit atp10 [Tulasnella sp. JGI-2019a]